MNEQIETMDALELLRAERDRLADVAQAAQALVDSAHHPATHAWKEVGLLHAALTRIQDRREP